MRRQRWRIGIAVVGLTFLPVIAAASDRRDLSGEYVMAGKGVGEDDRAYAGTCSIKAVETLYEVSCFNADTRHTYIGKGIGHGDQFSTVIGDLLKGDHSSVYVGEYLVTYRVAADGGMKGRWVHAQSGAQGEETLTPKW
ncbi:MAG: hypothetical protein PS018_23020 [bacterium]|nr:hypothetical protein [bacterium]